MKKGELKRAYNRNILKMYGFELFQNLHFFSGVLIPFFMVWGGISFAQVMILQAIFTFSIFMLEIPTGAVADRFGRKISLALSGFIGVIACLVYVAYPNFWVFALSEFIFAMGFSLASGADQAMIYDSLKQAKREKESKKIFGRWGTVMLISIMIAAPIGSLLGHYFGLRIPMMATSIPFLIIGIIALTLKEPPQKTRDRSKDYFKILIGGVKYFKNHRILKILTFDYVSIQVFGFFLIWVYQVILQNLNVSIGWFGFVHAAMVLGEIIILNTFVPLEKLFGGKKRYLFFSALIIAGSYITLALTGNVYLAVSAMIFCSAFGMTRKPLFASYFNNYIDSHNRATVLSAISMVYSLVATIINIVFGYLVDWNLRYSLIIIGVLVLACAFLSKIEEAHLKE